MPTPPLMPKATAVWLIDHTNLTFEQIGEFCGLHKLEVQAIADGEVAVGIVGLDPVANGQVSRDEILKGEQNPDYHLAPSSAPDLVRFGCALDEDGRLLSRESVARLFAPPPAPVGVDEHGAPKTSFYACGWAVDLPTEGRAGEQHHNGMLPGSASVLRRRDDGVVWAALFNLALGRQEAYLGGVVVELMAQALGEIKTWPAG